MNDLSYCYQQVLKQKRGRKMDLLMIDQKCRDLQKMVYTQYYNGHKPNSFDPWNKPNVKTLDNGLVCHTDICYSKEYPNSFFDVWYPDNTNEKRPVFIYIHGGGFLFGDKTQGDPLSASKAGTSKLAEIVQAGYIVVNADYALAPEYRFPVQIRQLDSLLRYLTEHAEELHLDMTRICLSGSSAGADMTLIYGTCVTNPAYAEKLSIMPVLTPETLKVLAIDEAALDSRAYDRDMYTMLLCWLGDGNEQYQGRHILMNAKEHINNRFIPSWINTSNRGAYFIREATDLAKKLDTIDCDHDLVYFTKDQADLDHGYMDLFSTNKYARQALDRMLAFVGEHI